MQSRYQGKTTATGTIEAKYESEAYDYTISKDAQGHLEGNFTKHTEDSNVIMQQLIEDLAGATVKLETLVEFIGSMQKTGLISEELYNQMLGFVHDDAIQETSSKTR